MQPLFRIAVTVPRTGIEAAEAAIEGHCVSVFSHPVDGDADDETIDWEVGGLATGFPDTRRIEAALAEMFGPLGLAAPKLASAPVPERDWLASSLASFTPVHVGPFYVHGSHVPPPYPPGAYWIEVDAATAFGSGEHGSTSGCLEALGRLAKGHRFRSVLDVGTGSGVLAIACARAFPARVVAVDIDPVAARVAAANVRRNGVADRVRAGISRGYAGPLVRRYRPYDLIVANVLANPLIEMAPAFARHLAPGGVAVLSGFLPWDAPRVAAAHRMCGLARHFAIERQGWSTLVLRRPKRRGG